MKCARGFVAVLVLIVAAVIPASAAEGDPIQGYIAGGYSQPLGDAEDYVNGGWNLSGGMIWNFSQSKPFAVRFDLGFNTWDAKNSVIQNIPGNVGQAFVDGGYANMWTLTADALWKFGKPGGVGGYLGVGMGGYRRYAALTNEVIVPGYYCDPWWGYCYTGAVGATQTVAHNTLTKFGFNSALGVTFPVGNGALYLEAQLHYVDTPQATEFIPVLIGYRF